MRNKIILLAAALAALAACQKNENTENNAPESRIPVNLSIGVASRATDTAYENGDAVGIFMYNTGGVLYSNNKTVKSATAWTPAQPMWWPDDTTPADFYCYYPYTTTADVDSYAFAVKTDQSTEANYRASDFVWGKLENVSPTTTTLNIGTSHILSNVNIYVTPGNGFTEETLAAATVSVKIKGLKTNANVNLKTGSVTASGDASDITPFKTEGCYKAIVVPQTVTAENALITVTVNGSDYSLSKALTFNPGKRSKFTVKVNKTSSGINIGIGDWDNEEDDFGGDAE